MRLATGLRQNFGLRVLSVALALLLWSFVHGGKVVERELWLPVRYMNLPDSLILQGDPAREALVLLSGPTQELTLRLRFLPGSELRVDLAPARSPVQHVVLAAGDVVLPSNSKVTALRVLEPQALDLRIECRLERLLPVRVALAGQLPAGYCLEDSPRAVPLRVRCSGPASAVRGLQQVRTRPLDLSRRRGDIVQQAAVEYDRARVRCDPSEVRVEMKVVRIGRRTLLDAPITVVPPATGGVSVELEPARVTMLLSGPMDRLAMLDPHQVELVLDLSALGPGRHGSLRLAAHLPGWARLDSLQPPTVSAIVHQERARP